MRSHAKNHFNIFSEAANSRLLQIYENQTKFPPYLDIVAITYSADHFHYANIDHTYALDSTTTDEHSPHFL